MATNKKSTAKKTAAKKVTKTAPKKCATRTCKCKKKDQKNEKHKFIIFGLAVILIILCGSLGAMTWARYATTASGTASAQIAKWDVLISQDGSTSIEGSGNTLTFGTPTNAYTDVVAGKIAPGSVATAPFIIDFGGTEVETEYEVRLTKPATLAARNAVITVTLASGSGGSSPTCADDTANSNVYVCTGTFSLAQISANPVATFNVEINWDSHTGYTAGQDNTTDTEDGRASAQETNGTAIELGIDITARQAFHTNP